MASQTDHCQRQITRKPGVDVFHKAKSTYHVSGKPRKLHSISDVAVIGYVVSVAPEPPALPAVLLKPWPVIVVIAAGWLIATVLAFTVPGLHEYRPFTVAGLGIGVLGTSIFLWQRRAVRRGSRGAQSGLS